MLKRQSQRPYACIVGEPTRMKPVRAHKGQKRICCKVHGLESHSALPDRGVNAVEAAAEVIAYLKMMARRIREEGPHDPDFDPPYTTVHTGKVHGGTALNIVPKECSFEFEFLSIEEDVELAQLTKALTGVNRTGTVAFGTEAGLFQNADIPTIVCGPGDIEQAHKPNEFIALDQIVEGEAFIRRLMDRICASA